MNYPKYDELSPNEVEIEKARIAQEGENYRAKLEARESTKEAFAIGSVIVCVAVVLSLLFYFVYDYNKGGSQREQEYRISCLESDGSWVPVDDYDNYTCIQKDSGIEPKDVWIDD